MISLEKIKTIISNTSMSEKTEVLEQTEVSEITATVNPCKVIVFNDEEHTFDQVIIQIIKATGCAQSRAEELTWEIHSKGKAAVYSGDITDCLKVTSILEEIALHTQIEF